MNAAFIVATVLFLVAGCITVVKTKRMDYISFGLAALTVGTGIGLGAL